MTTDKQSYSGTGPVTIKGLLRYNNNPITDGLVGLEIQDPNGNPIIVRTIQSGAATPQKLPAEITSAYLSDSSGHQRSNIQIGALAGFAFNFVNTDSDNMLITINLFDSSGTPIAEIFGQPTQSGTAILSIQIPTWAHEGIAHGYANIYSDWPSKGGAPLALEKTFQFSIVGGDASSSDTSSVSGNKGAYAFTFNLPSDAKLGAYTVYGTSAYSGATCSQSTSFNNCDEVNSYIGDFNDDKRVDFADFLVFTTAYIQWNKNHNYTSICDLNQDFRITYDDFVLFKQNYDNSWS
jgi:hypothetical protein